MCGSVAGLILPDIGALSSQGKLNRMNSDNRKISLPTDRDAFIALLGGIYEHSDWVAEKAFGQIGERRDCSVNELAKLMASIVEKASSERKATLLCAHPDLAGTPRHGGGADSIVIRRATISWA